MNDEQKRKMLSKFQKDFAKLMNKYPDVMVMGDRDGDVQGNITLQGRVQLTYHGKVIQ